MEYVPPVRDAGVPASTPVVELNVTPAGRVPDSESVGAGEPVATTVNVPGKATVNWALLALTMEGAEGA